MDDTEGFEGLVFAQKVAKVAGGPTRVEKAKIAVLQVSAAPSLSRACSNHRHVLCYAGISVTHSIYSSAYPPRRSLSPSHISRPSHQPPPPLPDRLLAL